MTEGLFESDTQPDTIGAQVKALLEKSGREIDLLVIIPGLQAKVHPFVHRYRIGEPGTCSKTPVKVAK